MARKAARNMYNRIPIKLEFSAPVGSIHKELNQGSMVHRTLETEFILTLYHWV